MNLKPNWLKRQIKNVTKDMKMWPLWMKKATHIKSVSIPSLTVRWNKKQDDFVIKFPDNRADMFLISNALFSKHFTDGSYFNLQPSLLTELEKRGYDTKTLVFSCKKKSVSKRIQC